MRFPLTLFLLAGVIFISAALLLDNNLRPGITGAAILNISQQTKAVCEKTNDPDCPIRCEDKVFSYISGEIVRIDDTPYYACRPEGWEDPRK